MTQGFESSILKGFTNGFAGRCILGDGQLNTTNPQLNTHAQNIRLKPVDEEVFARCSRSDWMASRLKALHDVHLHQTHSSHRPPMVAGVVLLVAYTAIGVNFKGLNGMFRNAAFWIDMQSTDDARHVQTSVCVVGLGVGLGLEALALTDFTDDLVKQLRW